MRHRFADLRDALSFAALSFAALSFAALSFAASEVDAGRRRV